MTMSAVPADEEVLDRVRRTLREQFGAIFDPVGDDDELRAALGERYDSLAALECITRVEAEFGIEVDFVVHDLRYAFSTVRRICRFVRDQLEDLAVMGERR